MKRAFGGIHVISPSMLKPLCAYAPQRPFSIVPFYVSVCRDMFIKSYEPDNDYYWFDIGRHSTLAAAVDWLRPTAAGASPESTLTVTPCRQK